MNENIERKKEKKERKSMAGQEKMIGYHYSQLGMTIKSILLIVLCFVMLLLLLLLAT